MKHRYDFIYLFDVTDANPNGDPDAGNLPRIDTETGQGLATDVMLKRKIRNFVTLTKNLVPPFGIYVEEGAVLGRAHVEAFKSLGISLGEESKGEITEEVSEELDAAGLPDGIRTDEDDEERHWLVIEGIADKKEIKEWLKATDLSKDAKSAINKTLKGAKGRPPTRDETKSGKQEMCKNYFDIPRLWCGHESQICAELRSSARTGSDIIRPFGRSHRFERTRSYSLCCSNRSRIGEAVRGNRTMGRKFTLPYALFARMALSIPSWPTLPDSLRMWIWSCFSAGSKMHSSSTSAARPPGSMAPRELLVFRHDGTGPDGEQKTQQAKLGCAASHALFDRLKITSFEEQPTEDGKPPRFFDAYKSRITFDGQPLDDSLKWRVEGSREWSHSHPPHLSVERRRRDS